MGGRRFELDIGDERLVGVYHRGLEDLDACVIACHGLASYKDSHKYHRLAEACLDHGLSCVRFDFRGLGESTGRFEDSIVSKRLQDLEAVLGHVRGELGHANIGLFGSSLGGYVALLEAATDPGIKAVVAIATPFRMMELLEERARRKGVDVNGHTSEELGPAFVEDLSLTDERLQEALGDLKVPTLLVHGSEDEVVPFVHAKRIAQRLGGVRELVMVADADHVFSDPEHLGTVLKASMEWYRKHVVP
jgi:alpha-beta hydrolase superfamily lysophospholipase